MAKKPKIKLKPGASIGQPAAEDDEKYLKAAFVNHPVVEALKDVNSHQCVLLGRTGSGKSAVLWHMEKVLENVTRIDPKEVAFQYVGNSAIIHQVRELGVDLHTLYEYLWTHILALHITREFLGLRTSAGVDGLVATIKRMVWADPKRQIAVDYLEKHANSFWLDVEQVSLEITSAISEKLAMEVGLSPGAFKTQVETGADWKDEHKRILKNRAPDIVRPSQMRDLKETINALAECMDQTKSFYILIDDLDREWAGDESIQYALIRALIEALKTLRRIPNVKVVVAMREDLYEATLRTTTDKHFQAEKLEGIVKRLRWTDALLGSVVEKRIQELFKYTYTKQSVTLTDILPATVTQKPLHRYLIGQTLRRPRDMITFVNRILSENEGEGLPLPARAVTKAEPGYSNARLRALEDEWRSCHPLIGHYLQALQGQAGTSTIEDFDEEKLFALIYEVNELERRPLDDVERIAKSVYERDKQLRVKKLAGALVSCLYKIGAVAVKLKANLPYESCYGQRVTIGAGEITEETPFTVQPMLISALGGQPSQADAA